MIIEERTSVIVAIAQSILLHHTADAEMIEKAQTILLLGGKCGSYLESVKKYRLYNKLNGFFLYLYETYKTKNSQSATKFNSWTGDDFDQIFEVYDKKQVHYFEDYSRRLEAVKGLSVPTKQQYTMQFDNVNSSDKDRSLDGKVEIYKKLLKEFNLV